MARVNVVTSVTDSTCPAKMKRVGMWLVEVIEPKGLEEPNVTTYQGTLERESITGKELTLQLLANGLTKLKKLNKEFDSISMYFNCQPVESAFLNKWLDKWSKDDWKSARGEDVADKETWILVWELLTDIGKDYIAMREKSSYANWMQTELKKMLKKIADKEAAVAGIKKINEILG